MPSDIMKKLAALVSESRSGHCDDVKYGDNCGKCHYCLAWALDDDWAEQLQIPAIRQEPARVSGVKVDWSLVQEQAKQILKERAEEAE